MASAQAEATAKQQLAEQDEVRRGMMTAQRRMEELQSQLEQQRHVEAALRVDNRLLTERASVQQGGSATKGVKKKRPGAGAVAEDGPSSVPSAQHADVAELKATNARLVRWADATRGWCRWGWRRMRKCVEIPTQSHAKPLCTCC
jgi:hypothetical protein